METRNRSYRAAPASASYAPERRSTVNNTHSSAPAPTSSAKSRRHGRGSRYQQSSDPAALHEPYSNQIPRRGARAPSSAASARSIATVPTRVEAETEAEADEDEPASPREPAADTEDIQNEDEATRRDILAQCLPDLLRASEELVKHLHSPDRGNSLFRALLKLKRKAFLDLREIYEERREAGEDEGQGLAPFIDWTKVDDLNMRKTIAVPAATVLTKANLATVLDIIEKARSGSETDFQTILSKLNTVFPKLLSSYDQPRNTAEVALDIRTHFAIGSLAREKEAKKSYAIIASIFCGDTAEKILPKVMANGPFRPLVDHRSPAEREMCSKRVSEIAKLARKKQLSEAYQLTDLLESLKAWAEEAYASVTARYHEENSASQSIVLLEPDEFHDAEEQIANDAARSLAESRSIDLAPDDGAPSLFSNERSLQVLNLHARGVSPTEAPGGTASLFRNASSVQFLNQQVQQGSTNTRAGPNFAPPPPSAPQDYPQHSNEEILGVAVGPRRPKVNSSRRVSHLSPLSDRRQQPAKPNYDNKNPFQRDGLEARGSKRLIVQSLSPPPKRARSEIQRPPASMLPPATTRCSATPQPSQPEASLFAGLSEEKRAFAARRRQAYLPPVGEKLRHSWSEKDCQTLLNLVAEHHAAWSVIETYGHDLFDHRRNQQAYRDKARNMKVDFLMLDKALPPCFDLVHLGKKEITRLQSLGKNPWRRERDVDEWLRPINTEFVDSLHDDQ